MQNPAIQIDIAELKKLYPYLIIVDDKNRVVYSSKWIKNNFPNIGLHEDFFTHWNIETTVKKVEQTKSIEEAVGKLCTLRSRKNLGLTLKGQFELINEGKSYIFYGNPSFTELYSSIKKNKNSASPSEANRHLDLLNVFEQTTHPEPKNLSLFKKIIDNSSDAIQVSLEDGSLYYINETASRRLGIQLHEVNKFNVADFEKTFSNAPEKWQEHVKLLKEGIVLTIEGMNQHQESQEVIPVEVTVKYVVIEEIGFVVAISRDISERKLNELKLKNQEKKYRNIISNMNLGLLETNNEGEIVFVNKSFEKLSGYHLEELIGKNAHKFFPNHQYFKFFDKNTKKRKEDYDSYETLVINKEGTSRWWLISAAPKLNDKGEVTGFIGIHLDISNQKRLEHELELALLKSEQASDAKESFLANMSHEIRTPLNGIIGMIRALKDGKLTSQQQSYINSACKASEHLLAVINDILDITKIEAGEFELYQEEFSLNKLLDDVHQILKLQAKEKSIDLQFNIKNLAGVYLGDNVRLRQVIINLLGNALKFTEEGEVSVACVGGDISDQFQDIEIKIIDTGIGMSKAFLDGVFEKFHQEDLSIRRKFGGSGLGLAITKEIIDLMGGSINISSLKGRGTTISINLKLKISNKEISFVPKHVEDTSLLINSKILLVEDNEMNVLVLKHVLDGFNIKFIEAKNGIEALNILRNEKFDLILMDIQMPVMDGMEATKIIRNQLKITTPIIALSANAFKSEIDACLAIGINDYVVKPFDKILLVNAMVKALSPADKKPVTYDDPTYNLRDLRLIAQGNDEFLYGMLKLFIDIIPQSIKDLKAAFQVKDYDEIRKIAHRIKPSIDNMGIKRVKEEIRILENLNPNDFNEKSLQELVNLVCTSLQKAVLEINENELKDKKPSQL